MILSSTGTGKSQSQSVLEFASAAARSGNVIGARQALLSWLVDHPCDADVLEELARIAVNEKCWEEATLLLQRAISADPTIRRRIALIEILHWSGNDELALTEIGRLEEAVRNLVEIKEIEADVRNNLGDHERVIRLRQQIVHDRPSEPWHRCRLATTLQTIGRTGEAVKTLRRASRASPNYGITWWQLANLKTYRFSGGEISMMLQALGRKLSDEDLLHIHFALGKAFEDRSEFEKSFHHYAAANAIRAKSFSSEQTVSDMIDEAIAGLTPDLFERNQGAGCNGRGPIFVVGLHRSGSTLVEQILASHPMIEGVGELPVIGNIVQRIERETGKFGPCAIAGIAPEQFRSIGEEYLEKTRAYRKTERPFFVDKMPANWVHVPLIRLALPNAKIIDARRHPMACGFSNFKQHYPEGIGYSFSLKTIGIFYRDYLRFMSHFDRLQPGAVHRVINERLVENLEREVRAMLDYLALPFERNCLEFHRNERSVQTPSASQVRAPINAAAVSQWKNYEPWLGELKEALGPVVQSWAD